MNLICGYYRSLYFQLSKLFAPHFADPIKGIVLGGCICSASVSSGCTCLARAGASLIPATESPPSPPCITFLPTNHPPYYLYNFDTCLAALIVERSRRALAIKTPHPPTPRPLLFFLPTTLTLKLASCYHLRSLFFRVASLPINSGCFLQDVR